MAPHLIALWLLTVGLGAAGQMFLKSAAIENAGTGSRQRWATLVRRPWLWLGIAMYAGEFVAWLAFLSLNPLSSSILLASISIVVVLLGGRLFFHETLSPARIVGIVFIVAGVFLVSGS